MKVLAKPIQMIVWFAEDGTPTPIRFKIKNKDESESVINVDRILSKDLEKLAGNKMLVFKCQSLINNTNMVFELKFELNTCKWILFKM